MHDSSDENRILIFTTDDDLQLLQQCNHWFMDGTFSTVPTMYTQLYTVHGLTENRTIPCVYVLLPTKQQQTYTYMFNQMLLLNPRLNPISVMCDFEKAALNALTAVFPQATLKGCFFHLTQNIYRHIQSSGLQRQYQVH